MEHKEYHFEEISPRPSANRSRPGKRKRKIKLRGIILLLVLLVALLVALSCTVLFPVKTIVVSGESRYSQTEIVAASGILPGDNIPSLRKDQVEERILSGLPYIQSVQIRKNWFGKITLEVADGDAVLAYLSNGVYYGVNALGKIVSAEQTEPTDLCVITGCTGDAPTSGQPYRIQDETLADHLKKFQVSFAENQLQVTRIMMEEPENPQFVLEQRILVQFGTMNNYESKMQHLLATLTSMSADKEGTLDLTWWTPDKKDAYFRSADIEKLIYGIETFATAGEKVGEEKSSEASDLTDVVEDTVSVSGSSVSSTSTGAVSSQSSTGSNSNGTISGSSTASSVSSKPSTSASSSKTG